MIAHGLEHSCVHITRRIPDPCSKNSHNSESRLEKFRDLPLYGESNPLKHVGIASGQALEFPDACIRLAAEVEQQVLSHESASARFAGAAPSSPHRRASACARGHVQAHDYGQRSIGASRKGARSCIVRQSNSMPMQSLLILALGNSAVLYRMASYCTSSVLCGAPCMCRHLHLAACACVVTCAQQAQHARAACASNRG